MSKIKQKENTLLVPLTATVRKSDYVLRLLDYHIRTQIPFDQNMKKAEGEAYLTKELLLYGAHGNPYPVIRKKRQDVVNQENLRLEIYYWVSKKYPCLQDFHELNEDAIFP